MSPCDKRKATVDESEPPRKRAKGKKSWITPRRHYGESADTRTHAAPPVRKQIEPGDSGIWATCNKGRQAKCVIELRELFQNHAERLNAESSANDVTSESDLAINTEDMEAEIEKELEGLRQPSPEGQFESVKLDTPCLVFFKVRSPIEPVPFVKAICMDAAASSTRKQSRSVKRLTPITLCGKATEKGLEEVAQHVLAPHFHQPGIPSKKFAIRTNFRNHTVLNRDGVIKKVAEVVGTGHQVDLKFYDLLILVEIYQNICGISVVGEEFGRLKKFNLAEIYEPTPKPQS